MRPAFAPALRILFAQEGCKLFPSTAAPHWNHPAHRMTRGVGPHFFFKEVVGFLGSFVDALQTHVWVFLL